MELNKIAASILLSGLIIMIVSNVVDMLYSPEEYKIEHQTIVAAGSNEFQQKSSKWRLILERSCRMLALRKVNQQQKNV